MEGQYWSMAAGMSVHHLLLLLAYNTPGSIETGICAEVGTCVAALALLHACIRTHGH